MGRTPTSGANGLGIPRMPSQQQLEAAIHRLALDTENIKWSVHAQQRMAERGIDDIDVLRILRQGHVEPQIEPGKNKGEWLCKIVKAISGKREAGVVTIVVRDERLILVTVEWEDIR